MKVRGVMEDECVRPGEEGRAVGMVGMKVGCELSWKEGTCGGDMGRRIGRKQIKNSRAITGRMSEEKDMEEERE
jgi:hypothetical protein